MLGYDWARLHAALNDLPAALLLAAVLFDLLGAVNKRDSLKAAGFWCLFVGVLGTVAAIISGRATEGGIDHTDAAHAVMETHETLAYITLAIFGLLLVWRVVRKGVWNAKEQPVALTAGVIGIGILVVTAKLGGNLVFEHGLGISTSRVEAIVGERGGHAHSEGEEDHEHAPADSASAPRDSAMAGADSAAAGPTHTHADGKKHTH